MAPSSTEREAAFSMRHQLRADYGKPGECSCSSMAQTRMGTGVYHAPTCAMSVPDKVVQAVLKQQPVTEKHWAHEEENEKTKETVVVIDKPPTVMVTYFCTVCRLTETVSQFTEPLFHRHGPGGALGGLGMVRLQPVR